LHRWFQSKRHQQARKSAQKGTAPPPQGTPAPDALGKRPLRRSNTARMWEDAFWKTEIWQDAKRHVFRDLELCCEMARCGRVVCSLVRS
jgi:hypothetical protein